MMRRMIRALTGLSLAWIVSGCLGVQLTPPPMTAVPSLQATLAPSSTPVVASPTPAWTATVAMPSPTQSQVPTATAKPGSPSSPPTSILDLDFVTASRGWVLGTSCDSSGLCSPSVYTTGDGGRTWSPLTQPVSLLPTATPAPQGPAAPAKDVAQVRFLDAQRGWAFDPGFFATTDGGRSWSDLNPPGEINALEVAGGTAWALQRHCTDLTQCSFSVLAYGGAPGAWQSLSVQPQVLGNEVKMARPTASDAWVISWIGGAPSNLVTTHDGGGSWKELASPCVSSFETAIAALDASRVWILCGGDHAMGLQEKSLFLSGDGGVHWDLVASASVSGGSTLPISGYVAALWPVSSQVGWIGLAEGTLYRTANGGQAWKPAISGEAISAGVGVSRVLFVDPNTGWAASGNQVYWTTDGGSHWKPVSVQ
jgi:photosystem II stability/assembly factor-like uncharacterized protein